MIVLQVSAINRRLGDNAATATLALSKIMLIEAIPKFTLPAAKL
jgi:hypothetical protein